MATKTCKETYKDTMHKLPDIMRKEKKRPQNQKRHAKYVSPRQILQHARPPHKLVTPGVHASPILLISLSNLLLTILLPPAPPNGACSSGS